MSISFLSERALFTLETQNTRYAFQLAHGKFPVHLYYGAKDDTPLKDFSSRDVAFSPVYSAYEYAYVPDLCPAEYNGSDSGDFRAASLKVRNANGDSTTVLTYRDHRVFKGRLELPGLPFAAADANTETLELTLEDTVTEVAVRLYYTVFEKEDIISRYVSIENGGEGAVTVEKCMSLLLDLPDHGYDMISLYGSHNNERNFQRIPLHYGSQSVFSRRGASSHQFNPFIALCETGSTQTAGRVYGFNFVFSGNFLDEVEVDQHGATRVQIGLGSENFSWRLQPGETFVSPEAVMTFSGEGIGKTSRNFHAFVRGHILPPEPFPQRPVVLNTWEACFFDINEAEMERFAAAAADAGVDMLVMDDGWFGARNLDNAGLGDWYVNEHKFQNGLKAFVDSIKSHGIKFGIWIEPEMVNPDSELYRAHPEWCLQCKNRELMESRHQYVLDLGNPAVLAYLKEQFSKTFHGVSIDYFKWDANRHLTQVGSVVLPPERQGEAAYRHMLGIYELLDWFIKTYPNAMIENCSGGGGRYDLGMMKYSTMIWTSDNTEPHHRIRIQHSSMLAYPAATMSCHVSDHKACEDPGERQYRWHVAMGGALGYELHLPNATEDVRVAIKEQIRTYRTYEDLILRGEYYSLLSPFETNYSAYYYTNAERSAFLLSFLQQHAEEPREVILRLPEAVAEAVYRDTVSGQEYTGKQLQSGVAVVSENSEHHSVMWHFVKQ